MKQSNKSLPLALLLAALADAQAVTSYYSICPTATSTTITLDSTTTICPGPGCAGSTTVYVGPSPITTTGLDGRVTIYEEQLWTAPCPCDGGVCDATWTITRECPCTAPPATTTCPEGFTVTTVPCHECAQNGGPSTVTVTTPIASGPYANQAPAMGTPYNGASASAGASAYVSAGPAGAVATAGSNADASSGNGNSNSNGAANAGSNANTNVSPNAGAPGGNGGSTTNSGASANTNVNAVSNGGAPAPPAPAAAGPSLASNVTSSINPPIVSAFHGSADRTTLAASALAAGIVGYLAFML